MKITSGILVVSTCLAGCSGKSYTQDWGQDDLANIGRTAGIVFVHSLYESDPDIAGDFVLHLKEDVTPLLGEDQPISDNIVSWLLGSELAGEWSDELAMVIGVAAGSLNLPSPGELLGDWEIMIVEFVNGASLQYGMLVGSTEGDGDR